MMPRAPIRVQEKVWKCSKETIPALKSDYASCRQYTTSLPSDRVNGNLEESKPRTNQKHCWGKPGISPGEGGGRACILCNTKHAAGTTRCPSRGVKTFYYSPSLKRAPDHHICCSKPRMYLSCILLSNLTAAFFWWFLSFVTDTQCSITETTLDTIPLFLTLSGTW